jgi:hypothetical protein
MDERYGFNIQTEKGNLQLAVPAEEFKVCSCGCDLFRHAYKITWANTGMIGAPPLCLRVDVYLCDKCGNELTPQANSKKQLQDMLKKDNV